MATDYATLKKGGFMRQKQKNHFSLRLSVVGGQVSADQLVAITEVANKYGHGYIHLTSRQGIDDMPYCKGWSKTWSLRTKSEDNHCMSGGSSMS